MINRINPHLEIFLKFCSVGAVGFAVDGGILTLLHNGLGWSPLVARIPSFSVAVIVTWLLNKHVTFKTKSKSLLRSFLSYFVSSLAGIGINLAIYTFCIDTSNVMRHYPIAALAIASGIALFFNFLMAKLVLFRHE